MKLLSMKPYFNYTLVVMLSVMATLFFGQNVSAYNNLRHEPRVEFRTGISGYPFICNIVTDQLPFAKYDIDRDPMNRGDLLYGLYGDSRGDVMSGGNFHLAAGYRFKGWFTLSGYLMYNQMWQNVYEGTTGAAVDTKWSHVVAVSPEVKFTFLNKRYVQMYGSLAAGLSFYKDDEAGFMDYEIYPHVQVVPFGISVGRRFFGFTELGCGTEFMGMRAGLGIRF
ncbi:MAG: hypothetical protein IJV54_02040 [Bacteroidales bacterium]|nr:hypothetical protein [Bacteroidales bacterium]